LTPSPYSNISTEQYDVARGEEYDDRFQEPNSSPDYRPNVSQLHPLPILWKRLEAYVLQESLVTIRKKSFMATISSSRDSFISSETVDILKLETKKVKAGKYTNPDSGKEYDIRESVKVSIELTGGEKLRDVQLYVITRRCPMKNPVVLGTGVLGTTEPASPDYPSPRSIDSGYGTASMPSGYGAASSRHPSVNQPLRPLAATFTSTSGSATYPVGQPSYSSAPSVPHRPLYTQTMSNVQETSSSSYPNSSYPAVRTMSHGTSSSYYPQGDGRHGSHHETYAPSTSSHDRKQDSRSSSYDAKGHSEGGMEYNSPHDGDHYSLHSGSHSSYITPRPTSFSDEPQNVYSSASDDTVYADYVAH
jgi:hypothetical protein